MYITAGPQATAPPSRLTRKQSQAQTRARLLDAAATVFARNGLERTSIEQIAAAAGHTRGAFYAHFASREELYLAMLEQRFDRYLEQFGRTLEGDEEPEVRARRAGDQLSGLIDADPESQRLFYELAVYALRHEGFRRELTKRYRALRAGVAETFRMRAEEYGIEPPIPLDRLALMTFAIAIGVALDQLLEPGDVPEELHGEILALLFAGLRTAGNASDG